MRRAALSSVVAALLLTGVSVAAAQSLADVARKEAERRKAIQNSGKVYTNDSLQEEPPRSVPPPGQPASGATPASTPATPGSTSPSTPAAGAPAPAPAPQNEAEWRKRMADARDALSRSQIFAEALQTRINALTTDFVNRDDPSQRQVVASERQKALAELDRVKQDIQTQQKAITAVQDEARRGGIPAGWVR